MVSRIIIHADTELRDDIIDGLEWLLEDEKATRALFSD